MPYKNPEDKKKWYLNNKDKNNSYFREWFSNNKEKRREYKRRWREKNRGNYRASIAAYRAQKKLATPSWVNMLEIKEIYKDAVKKKLHVDHIIPLANPNVCGLHVPWNLQLLPKEENFKKGNRFKQE